MADADGRARLRQVGRRIALRRRPADPPAGRSAPAPTPGPKPAVAVEQTRFGPVVDQLVARLRRNQAPHGVDADYDRVRERFDHYHYLFQVPELAGRPDTDPIREFLDSGVEQRTSPERDFSMDKYLDRYPEKEEQPEPSPYLEWLEHGKAAGELGDPADGVESIAAVLGAEPQQVLDEVVRLRTDAEARLRSGVLGEMFTKAAELEPLIGAAWPEAVAGLRQLPLRNESVTRAAAAIYRAHQAVGFRRARIVIVTDRPAPHGPHLDQSLARALAGTIAPDEVVVIYTAGRADPDTPNAGGVREINLGTALTGVSAGLRAQALVALIRSLRADAVINRDSGLFYRAWPSYGRALADSERVFMHFTGSTRRPLGDWDGSVLRWVYPSFDHIAGIITDGDYLRDSLIDRHRLTVAARERIHVFRTPARPEIPVATAADRERRTVFWAGHVGRPARLAVEIARRMPDVDFRLWLYEPRADVTNSADGMGSTDSDDGADGTTDTDAGTALETLPDLPRNASLDRYCSRLTELDLSGADAWLYTSTWNGVPELLLDVAMTEAPIVATGLRGVAELLGADAASLVAVGAGPGAYENALRDVLADPVRARTRSRALRERLIRERTVEAYARCAAGLLLKPADAPATTEVQVGR